MFSVFTIIKHLKTLTKLKRAYEANAAVNRRAGRPCSFGPSVTLFHHPENHLGRNRWLLNKLKNSLKMIPLCLSKKDL